ncbi:MAG: hypothetical protein WBC44_09435 [Planctomycetaceae bacterium]
MKSAALSIVALLLLSAAPLPSDQHADSTPTASPAASSPEATVDVAIQGPATAAGGFALIGSGPADAVLRWRIESPDGAPEPLRLRDEAGSPVLVFMSPIAGRYRVVLTGQVPADGLDPFGEATHVVTVGNVPPPVPPVPPVPPTPDLTGVAKVVYEAARGIDKATVAQAANAYGSQVSAINAGAYNAVALDAAKQQIASAIIEANPPREKSPGLFDTIDGQLQSLEEADKLGTLAAVSSALANVTTGLEAAAK